MPVIGFLDSRSSEALTDRLRGFRQGLAETGYVDGDNATIVYRWAENKMDRVPELAAELIRRQAAVILAIRCKSGNRDDPDRQLKPPLTQIAASTHGRLLHKAGPTETAIHLSAFGAKRASLPIYSLMIPGAIEADPPGRLTTPRR